MAKKKPAPRINFWRVIRRGRSIIELFNVVVELVAYVNKTRKDPKLNLIVDRIDALIKEIVA